MTFIASMANFKGGTSKTSTTVGLAGALARAGRRVLVVDDDPQGNATRRLGITIDPENPIVTISEVIERNQAGAGAAAVQPCGWEDSAESRNIDVIPARDILLNREEEAAKLGSHSRLRKALSGDWIEEYDVVLIDTRPDLGHLVQMALVASDAVVLVVSPDFDSLAAAVAVRAFLEENAEDLNPDLRLGGVVVSRVRPLAEHAFQIEGIQQGFGDLVFDLRTTRRLLDGTEVEVTPSYIPERVRIAEADSAAVSLSAWTDQPSRDLIHLYDELARQFAVRFLTQEA